MYMMLQIEGSKYRIVHNCLFFVQFLLISGLFEIIDFDKKQ